MVEEFFLTGLRKMKEIKIVEIDSSGKEALQLRSGINWEFK